MVLCSKGEVLRVLQNLFSSNTYELREQLLSMGSDTISISREEYEDLLEYMERMKETIDVLSNEESVRKLRKALGRIEHDDFLTKEEMRFDDP
jgi:tRNA C32,U32 (ribose-2'-O)-methylase TrmJ